MNYKIKQLSFGKTWVEALNIYLENFSSLFLIALIGVLPVLFFPQISTAGTEEIAFETAAINLFVWFMILIGLSTLSAALMIEFISKKYLHIDQTIKQYINSVLSDLPLLMGLSIIEAIAVALGFMAFIIPGIYIALSFSLAVAILIIERRGIIDSLKRSVYLTQGKKVEIMFYSLVLALISLIVEKIMNFFFSIVDPSQLAINIKTVILIFTQALLAPLGACIFILIYFNIKMEKEGLDQEHMIEQFTSQTRR